MKLTKMEVKGRLFRTEARYLVTVFLKDLDGVNGSAGDVAFIRVPEDGEAMVHVTCYLPESLVARICVVARYLAGGATIPRALRLAKLKI